jgi:uncharacterized protein YceK
MRYRLRSAVLTLAVLTASGCAATVDLSDHRRIYGGSRLTVEYLTNSDGPWKRHQGWKLIAFYPVVAPCLLFDLPQTIMLDTLALPYTIARAISSP